MFLIIFSSVEILEVKYQEVPEDMASTTRDISKVPTEILFAIFQFLPLEGLQGVRLVCRRW